MKKFKVLISVTLLASFLTGCTQLQPSETTAVPTTVETTTLETTTETTTEATTTETTEPYSDIDWEPICEEGFSNYMLYSYDINLRDYILYYGFDSFLNDNFTDYVNQRFNTNYEFVPFEITKTYFKYYLKQSLNISEVCDFDNELLYNETYRVAGLILGIHENYFDDYNVYMELYRNNIPFGSIISSDIISPDHTTDLETILQLPNCNCFGYNEFFTQMNWKASNYSQMLENLDPEKKNLLSAALSTVFQEKGFEIYPVLDEYISYDFLIYRFPENKEEIDEVTAELNQSAVLVVEET